MTFKTIMVHMKLGQANSDLLPIASDMAKKFGARVIGIAACQPMPMAYSDGYAPAMFVDQDREEINRDIKVAETEFLAAFQGWTGGTEWRSATIFETVANYVSRESRSCDLIITSGNAIDPHENGRRERPGDIVMQAGRPVLVVPRSASTLNFDHMAVAWKNSREARRAVADALPLLGLAKHVTVLQIGHEDEQERVTAQLTEVCEWLKPHNIAAVPKFVALDQGDNSYQLNAAIEALGAGIVVAGAYGHSRLREWALGGVTRDLLLQADYCTMLSH